VKVHYSSEREDWETPQDFFDGLNSRFNFTLDVCATPENAKCERYLSKQEDALKLSWGDNVCWMNPPYGRQIGRWLEKAYKESQKRAIVVCLVPSRTDTRWWHDYCMRGRIEFLRGRLKFEGAKHNAPFPSAIVVFDSTGRYVR